jgi:hypothetical protein
MEIYLVLFVITSIHFFAQNINNRSQKLMCSFQMQFLLIFLHLPKDEF